MKTMQRVGNGMKRVAAVLIVLAAGGARASNNPDARFYGDTRDGYDQAVVNRSGIDLSAFRALLGARSRGGLHDGYAVATAVNVSMPPSGTLIMFR